MQKESKNDKSSQFIPFHGLAQQSGNTVEQGDALNLETADGYSNADERDIQLITLKSMVTYRKYYSVLFSYRHTIYQN